MKINEDEAYNSVKTSIEAHRTDVLKAVIDTIKKGRALLTFLHIYLCNHAFSFTVQIGRKKNLRIF